MAGKNPVGEREGLSRADLLLALMPLLFVGVYGVGALFFDTRSAPAAGASIACCLVIADCIFWHPPHEQ